MTDITRSDMETLLELQKTETEIVRIQSLLSRVEGEKERLEASLKKFEAAYEDSRIEFEKTSEFCREMENEIQVVAQRIQKSNETLRFVKTNKEYQVLQREVDDNRKRKELLENELIEHMSEREEQEAAVQEAQAQLVQLREKTRADKKAMDEKTADDKEALDDYLAQREKISRDLDPDLMYQFNRISKMNNGLAVVPVKKEVCMGCYVNIPPQLYIEVQRFKSLILCPQCSRILYYTE